MSSALLNLARRAAAQAPARVAASRVYTSAPKFGGADEPAAHTRREAYDVGATKARPLVFGVATAAVAIGGTSPSTRAIPTARRPANGEPAVGANPTLEICIKQYLCTFTGWKNHTAR